MADDQDITPAILLQHMQGMEQRLRSEFRTAINASEQRLSARVERVEKQMVSVQGEMKKGFALLSMQIDNIDKRLDDLEIVQVPLLKKAVGIGGKAGR